MAIPEILTLLIILGVAQGLFLAVLLLTRKQNPIANRILGGTMLAFSLFLIESVIYRRSSYHDFPHLIGVSQPLIYLFGPTIYLYALKLSDAARSLGRRALLHYLPALLVVAWLVPFYLQTGIEKAQYVDEVMRLGSPLDLALIEWLKLPHGILYTILTFRMLKRHRRLLEENFSSLDHINLRWLRNLLIGSLVVWLAATLQFILPWLGVESADTDWNLPSLMTAVFIYALGYLGLRQPEVFWPPVQVEASAVTEAPAVEVPGKYKKSGLDPERAAAQLSALLQLMDERKPYTDPNLTLHQLAQQLSVPRHNLSEIINTRLDRSFHDFANGYRVDEAKRRLRDPALSNRTVLAIAIDSGFRSKSTFNKIFKRFTGTTPSVFRRGD